MDKQEFYEAAKPKEGEKPWEVIVRLEREGLIKRLSWDDAFQAIYEPGWKLKAAREGVMLAITNGWANLYHVPLLEDYVLGVTNTGQRVEGDNLRTLEQLRNYQLAKKELKWVND